ncbi:MerR family regulatory protein [Modestobacter sp. DSM 44400]|uniref:transcriptional regulator FtsR n=1 Tax=Modestobacter sp. DSM 44400 TaxID=1550230 RepID=UPI000897E37A|nr:MerR family transcriptional regulator [Modestobacter sp. DSM 44400]SDY20366.1 MerR family regulatory protein [Modestobacter sp. DSM 44400]
MPQASGSADRDTTSENAPRLTIGEVLARLRGEFPDVTISKIRYLEAEDLVHPQRTPSGYRKFSDVDVSRLRYVLAAQRDQYLPLRVIKEQLGALDRGETLPGLQAEHAPPGDGVAVGGVVALPDLADLPPTAPLNAEEFAAAAGLDDVQLADCVQFGLVARDSAGRHEISDLPVARAVAGLAQHGIEPRHLRAYRTGAEREAALLEQLVAPVLRARSEEARARATEQLGELAALSVQLHTALLEARLRDVLGS